MVRGLLLICCCLAWHTAQAEVFKCSVGGKLLYQETPCSDSEVKDAPWARQRAVEQEKKRAVEERERREIENRDRQNASMKSTMSAARLHDLNYLRSCRGPDGECRSTDVQNWAWRKTPDELTSVLGPPSSVQRMGDNETWYYDLPLIDIDGKRRIRKVQVTFAPYVDPLGYRPREITTDRVNIY